MYSSDNSNTSLLLFFLTTLMNSDDPEYAQRIYRIIIRRLPELSQDKELSILFEELIESRSYSNSPGRLQKSGEGNSDTLLLFLLITLMNSDDPEYTDEIYRIIRRRLPRLSQDKELSILFEQLIRSRAFSPRSPRVRSDNIREIAEAVSDGFLRSFERTVSSRLQNIENQQKLFAEDQRALSSYLSVENAEIQSYLWLLDSGVDVSHIPLKRYIPIRIYISDPVPPSEQLSNLVNALDGLARFMGFEKVGEFPSEQGSWWKRFFYRTKETVSQPEVKKRIIKVEQAIQTTYLEKPQAEANKNQAEAVSNLVNALTDVPDACIQVGSLLFVKTTDTDGKPMVIARTLTAQELRLLEENQLMLRCPDRILEWLSQMSNQNRLEGEAES